ncbi:excinuclease ABC subunit UvrC [Flavobacteriales bacterium]|nr:excinuclease ABC subunit UvrC [Flavobacteriales bacterium]
MPADQSLKPIISTIPQKPGVYHFYDSDGEVIYVGKAKNLKRRVSSYFTKTHKRLKTKNLVSKITNIRCIIVETEIDALLLENNLIKKHQPRYNILLKDDKSYPWICIKREEFPRVFQTRNVVKDGSEYFGPYMSGYVVNVLLDYFSELFYDNGFTPDSYLNRKVSRSSKDNYQKTIDEIRKILKGDIKTIIGSLKNRMLDFSEKLDFENAQKTKEKISLLNNYQSKSAIVSSKINNVDVFSICSEKNFAFVNYLKITSGAVVLSHSVEIKKRLSEDDESILQFVITDLRRRFNSVSKTIFCSHRINCIWPETKLIVPLIGDKKKLIELSLRNAKYMQFEKKKLNLMAKEKKEKTSSLFRLKEDLKLKLIPSHIECFDNSNLQGTNPVAACVVFKNGRPSKKEYRLFNIKTVVGPDDYKSMEEVVFRRYKRLINEKKNLPQLIVIDGGKGQLSSAVKSLKQLNIDGQIAIIGIAKRLEEIYFPNDSTPLYLDKKSSSLKLIQQLRNEAHRFGINHHRRKRVSEKIKTSLDNISGIGPKTSTLLLKKFGSVKNLMKADYKTVQSLIGKSKAKKIFGDT